MFSWESFLRLAKWGVGFSKKDAGSTPVGEAAVDKFNSYQANGHVVCQPLFGVAVASHVIKIMTLLIILLQISISFSADVTNACVPFTTRFTSQTNVQPDSVRWDFGNGTTATTPTALATYSTVGSYNVTYRIYVHGQMYQMRVRHYINGKYCDCCNPNIKH